MSNTAETESLLKKLSDLSDRLIEMQAENTRLKKADSSNEPCSAMIVCIGSKYYLVGITDEDPREKAPEWRRMTMQDAEAVSRQIAAERACLHLAIETIKSIHEHSDDDFAVSRSKDFLDKL